MDTSDILELLGDVFDLTARATGLLVIAARLNSDNATASERENLSRALGRLLEGRSATGALRHTPGNGNGDRRLEEMW